MKTLSSLHVYIFFMIFEVHYTIFRYNVCLEEYMNLSPRFRSGTTLENKKPMRRTRRSGSQKKSNNTLTYSSIHQNIELISTLLLQRIHVFSILEAPYIEPL